MTQLSTSSDVHHTKHHSCGITHNRHALHSDACVPASMRLWCDHVRRSARPAHAAITPVFVLLQVVVGEQLQLGPFLGDRAVPRHMSLTSNDLLLLINALKSLLRQDWRHRRLHAPYWFKFKACIKFHPTCRAIDSVAPLSSILSLSSI